MTEVIVFPDVEGELRTWLIDALDTVEGFVGVDVYAGVTPTQLSGVFVHLQRTGGAARDIVTDVAQITAHSYAKTAGAAERLAQTVRGLLGSLERDGSTGSMTVHQVTEFSGPYLNPDPLQPERPRYTATYSVAVRGAAL